MTQPQGQGSSDQILVPGGYREPTDVREWLDDGTGQGQRYMGNLIGTLLSSAARTTNTSGIAMTNPNHRGLILYVNVTAVSGTSPTLQLRLNAIDPITGTAFPLWLPAAVAPPVAATEYVYGLYPSTLAGTFTASVNNILTRTWSVDALITGTTPSVTFSLAYSLLL